jgi:hypothetical protein
MGADISEERRAQVWEVLDSLRFQPADSLATPPASPSIHAKVTDTYQVGPNGQTNPIAYGMGSLWVTHYGAQDHLLHLNPDTGRQVADIPMDAIPGWEWGNGGIAFGGGSVWVTGGGRIDGQGPAQGMLSRIDPSTNTMTAEIPVGGESAADVVVDASGVWALVSGDQMQVVHVDPATNTVVSTTDIGERYGRHIFSIGGRIIALTNKTHVDQGGGVGVTPNYVMSVIDPSSGQLILQQPLNGFATAAAGDGALWVGGNSLVQLDPTTGDAISTFDISFGPAVIADGGIWDYSTGKRGTLDWFDIATGKVEVSVQLDPGRDPISIAVSPGAVWVLNYDGTLTRVDVSSN